MPMMKGSMGAKRSSGYPTSRAERMRATQEGRKAAGATPPKPKVGVAMVEKKPSGRGLGSVLGSMAGKMPAKPTPVGAVANAAARTRAGGPLKAMLGRGIAKAATKRGGK